MTSLIQEIILTSADHVVTVFASGDPVAVISAKLLLDGERIRYVTEGEGVQDLFGFGRALGGFNPVVGPVQLRVLPADAPLALEALRELREERSL